MDVYFYLFLVQDNVDPSIEGPFITEAERNEAAREYRAEGFDDGIFPLDITADQEPVLVSTDPYADGFFTD